MSVSSAPAATRFGFVFALWGAGLGAAAQYAKISVIFEPLGDHYGQEGAALGLLVSAVGVIGILLGVVAGIIVTRLTLRRAMLIGLILGGVLSLYQATLPSLSLFIASRVVEGVSHLLIVVAAPTLIAQASSLRGRGFTLTLWGTFFGVSFTLLILLGLPLVEALGLPALFVAHGLYMFVFAGGLWRVLGPDRPADTALKLSSVLSQHAAIYRSPRKNAAGLGWLFYTFCFVTTVTFLPGFIEEDIRRAVAAAMPLVSIIASLTIGVALLSVMSAVSATMLAFLTGAVLALALIVVPGSPVLALGFTAALGIIQGSSFAVVPELNESLEDRAQGNGAMAQTGNVGNSLGTPVIAALLAGAGYDAMMAALALSLACGFGIHLWMAVLRR
ncbi:MAG: MFS transporter [Pseudomonadota bacterium]